LENRNKLGKPIRTGVHRFYPDHTKIAQQTEIGDSNFVSSFSKTPSHCRFWLVTERGRSKSLIKAARCRPNGSVELIIQHDSNLPNFNVNSNYNLWH